MQHIPRLHILHNHGVMILADAVIVDGEARGTCIGGGYTNRLFHVTSHTQYKVGVPETYQLWGRTPRPRGDVGGYVKQPDGAVRLESSPVPGEYTVDVCTCG